MHLRPAFRQLVDTELLLKPFYNFMQIQAMVAAKHKAVENNVVEISGFGFRKNNSTTAVQQAFQVVLGRERFPCA
jgi:hypothetical protein